MTTDSVWASEKELEVLHRFYARMRHELLFGVPEDVKAKRKLRQGKEDNCKLVYILVGKTKFVAHYDPETQRAYKSDYYKNTGIEWKKFTFLRYLRPMDV